MYKNTKEFFREVALGDVAKIDIDNYISVCTNNFNPIKLTILLNDLIEFTTLFQTELSKSVYHDTLYTYFVFIDILKLSIDDLKTVQRFTKICRKIHDSEPSYFVRWKRRMRLDKSSIQEYFKSNKSRKKEWTVFFQKMDEAELNRRIEGKPIKLVLPVEFLGEEETYNRVANIYIDNKTIYLKLLEKFISDLIKKEDYNLKHDHIFTNNGFLLFDYIMKEFVPIKYGWQENVSFYYRQMEGTFIRKGIDDFKEWFNSNYEAILNDELLGKIKTKHQLAPSKKTERERNYATALKEFQSQKE